MGLWCGLHGDVLHLHTCVVLDVSAWSPRRAAASSTPARGLLERLPGEGTTDTTPASTPRGSPARTASVSFKARNNVLTVSAYAEEGDSELYFAVSAHVMLPPCRRHAMIRTFVGVCILGLLIPSQYDRPMSFTPCGGS